MMDDDLARVEAERQRQQNCFRRWIGTYRVMETAAPKRTLHRAKALEWLINTDHLIRISSFVEEGWMFYVIPPDQTGNETEWPLIRINIDCGSDGLSAVMFLIYCLHANVDFLPDIPSHDVHNDIKGVMRDIQMVVADTLFNQTYNLAHQPYNIGARQQQAGQAFEEWSLSADVTDAMLQFGVPRILADRRENHRIGELDIDAKMLELKTNPNMTRRQARVNQGRFLQPLARARELRSEWTMQLIRWLLYILPNNQYDRQAMADLLQSRSLGMLAGGAAAAARTMQEVNAREQDAASRTKLNAYQWANLTLEDGDI